MHEDKTSVDNSTTLTDDAKLAGLAAQVGMMVTKLLNESLNRPVDYLRLVVGVPSLAQRDFVSKLIFIVLRHFLEAHYNFKC